MASYKTGSTRDEEFCQLNTLPVKVFYLNIDKVSGSHEKYFLENPNTVGNCPAEKPRAT